MDAQTLGEAMGWTLSEQRYGQLLPAYLKLMQWASITTVNRAAMLAAQIGHESVGLKFQSEIWGPTAVQRTYDGRMGNRPGTDDWSKFRGHGWVQITGRDNHTNVSKWAHTKGIVPSPTFFVDDPAALGSDEFCWVGPAWYWTVARPDLNSYADNGWIWDASRAINGWVDRPNGIDDRIARWERCKAMGARLLAGNNEGGGQPVNEKVLDYSRDQIHQDTFYNCGPASTQTVVKAAGGGFYGEAQLGRELGTHTGGTDYIGQFPRVLNKYLPNAGYKFANMPNDPPTAGQKNQLWQNITNSILAGYGVIANIVAPPSNYPRTVAPSTISPAYGGGTVYHYFAVMGFSEAGGRRVWVADSGFSPFGYWMGFDQLATLIPPKGYAYSTAQPQHKEWDEMASKEEIEAIVYECMKVYLGPLISDVKDNRFQLTGSRDSIPGDVLASYAGHEQLGQNAEGNNLTLVDGTAALRRDNAELRRELGELRDLVRKLVK